jgi:hypothetical protein
MADMLDDAARHIPQSDKVAKPLEGLQQDQKRQPRRFTLRSTRRQLQLSLGRRIQADQFPAADIALEPRVDGFVNGRHHSLAELGFGLLSQTDIRP